MSDNNYNEDKKYILETIKHTSEYVNKLDSKFEEFKLETAKSVVAIQGKLAIGGAIVIVVVNYAMKHMV